MYHRTSATERHSLLIKTIAFVNLTKKLTARHDRGFGFNIRSKSVSLCRGIKFAIKETGKCKTLFEASSFTCACCCSRAPTSYQRQRSSQSQFKNGSRWSRKPRTKAKW